MNEAAFHRLVRGEAKGLGPSLARGALWGATVPYRAAVSLRNLAFDRGWAVAHRARVPVVSVGNITVGGTGKTPTVEWVARWFRRRGARVVILSRGYGADAGVNDEAMVLEENLPDVPHLQDPDRVRIAEVAVEELEPDLLVLDDGFQHRRLARDLDVVLLDALDPFGLGHSLPRGLLREPVGSLWRAGVVVLSRADLIPTDDLRAIRRRAERSAGPLTWVHARHAPLDLSGQGVIPEPLGTLADRKVAAFCGIGNPEGFLRTLARLGVSPAGFRAFPDHHGYTAADVETLTGWVRGLGADLALTTQKDLVKLRVETLGSVPLRALRIGLEILEGAETLERALATVLDRARTEGSD